MHAARAVRSITGNGVGPDAAATDLQVEVAVVPREFEARQGLPGQLLGLAAAASVLGFLALVLLRERAARMALRCSNERHARLARSALSQFAYAPYHEFQEPLRAIAGFARMFQQRYLGRFDASADELVKHILDGVHRLNQFIHGFRQYSNLAEGADDVAEAVVDPKFQARH